MSKGRKRKSGKGSRKPGARRATPWSSTWEQPLAGPDPAAYVRDLSPELSGAETAEIIERRLFAMPYSGTVVDDEDFPYLDPADPDERALLIQGEHPEYHEVLADPAFDGELDGASPRLHVTMHEVIANQLWANDPPEVWQAAQRLRDRGMDRHDVLHELCAALVGQMYPVLAHQEPFDADAYRDALNRLG